MAKIYLCVKAFFMNYILFDSDVRKSLLPFTYTKPVADLRVGILTIREKWEKYLSLTTTTITEEYLEEKYPMVELEENILINASFCPTKSLVEKVKNLSKNEAIFKGDDVLAFHTTQSQLETYTAAQTRTRNQLEQRTAAAEAHAVQVRAQVEAQLQHHEQQHHDHARGLDVRVGSLISNTFTVADVAAE